MEHSKFSNIKHEEKHNRSKFTIKNIDVSIVNALRRIVLSEIPNVAVSFDAYDQTLNDTKVNTNTSSLHNEFLGHRLSMIPLFLTKTEIDNYEEIDYRFVLNVKNDTKFIKNVTTNDIIIYNSSNEQLSDAEHQRIFPLDRFTNDPILITKLKPNIFDTQNGEAIDMEFKARKGIAKHNACWCPVSLCSYTFTIDDIKANNVLAELLNTIDDPSKVAKTKQVFNTLDRQRYYMTNEYNEPNSFEFVIQSECLLKPTELFYQGMLVLKQKLVSMVQDASKFEVGTINNDKMFFCYTIHEEDHTLANFLQSYILNNYCRKNLLVDYIGYFVPHPLETDVVIKLKFKESIAQKSTNDAQTFLQEVCKTASLYIDSLITEWLAFTNTQAMPKRETRNPRVKRVQMKAT